MFSNYDIWKTTDPRDREQRDEVPCEETPRFDDYDVCMWCGADPTQACQWTRP